MTISYTQGKNEYKNWILAETSFNEDNLAKYESIMSLGNGYMGLRATTEEQYVNENRNLFVAGTFNRATPEEVTELPNCADIVNIKISLNNEKFHLTQGKIISYNRYLNVKDGELVRNIHWQAPSGDEYKLSFKRFVSYHDLHLIVNKVEITPLTSDCKVKISSGINGRMTNGGSQHFIEKDMCFHGKKFMELIQQTNESKINVILLVTHNLLAEEELKVKSSINIERRRLLEVKEVNIKREQRIVYEKLSLVYSDRDKEYSQFDKNYTGFYSSTELQNIILHKIRTEARQKLKDISEQRYEALLEQSKSEWRRKWQKVQIELDSENEFDQLAIRLAQYHLFIMTPAHDNRYGIGAKGLSGEGYKGHSFWDTEIFILPFFSYMYPSMARSLLEYRYITLKGARAKAKENSYKGAMYPWESAWESDGEVTPLYGGANVVTGEREKILTGLIEQHISSDVTYGIWQYYWLTADKDFMEKYGYEITLDTAIFWASRLEYNEQKDVYEINNVIGPDEYKEHVNNNMFTNYMARWNMQKALECFDTLKDKNSILANKLDDKLNFSEYIYDIEEKIEKIVIQKVLENGIIPQDDTYLTLKDIDLSKYKKQSQVGSIGKDFNMKQLTEMQVSKQADILLLFRIMGDKFDKRNILDNWNYYEARTLHDSSLSLSTHSVLASELDNEQLAYDFFRKSCCIDFGDNMQSSAEGIHSASLGGIWQCIINGFAGVKVIENSLIINPKLPRAISRIKFSITYLGNELDIKLYRNRLEIENKQTKTSFVKVFVKGSSYTLSDKLYLDI